MYIHSKIKYIRNKRFSLHGWECLLLNLFQPLTEKKIVIVTMYRHPGSKVDKFIENYSQCLEQLFNEKKTFYILGDKNTNINERSSQVANYLNATESNGTIQFVTKSTRVSNLLYNTATVIDHIITNDEIHKLCPYVLPANLTDHYATILVIGNLTIKKK